MLACRKRRLLIRSAFVERLRNAIARNGTDQTSLRRRGAALLFVH
jgi:hypothetical protein